jgi:ribosomal-protein-alanine N-acetyltransferase
MPASITIEPAQDPDLEYCVQLMASTEPWITLGRTEEASRTILRRAGSEVYIAREGGRRVGFILLHPYGLAGSPYISSVAVEEDARGRGIGSQLLAFAESHFAGRRHLFLCVSSFNLRAQDLYRRLGYDCLAEFPNYVVEGHSELLFYKKLS